MSRRPLTLDADQELARMAPGGRLWSESPVRRPWPRVRQAGAPAAGSPWPFAVEFDDATSSTASSVLWSYDPHPELVHSVSVNVGSNAVTPPTAWDLRADGGAWVPGFVAPPDDGSPGGRAYTFPLPTPAHIATVEVRWSPPGLMIVSTFYVTPVWW